MLLGVSGGLRLIIANSGYVVVRCKNFWVVSDGFRWFRVVCWLVVTTLRNLLSAIFFKVFLGFYFYFLSIILWKVFIKEKSNDAMSFIVAKVFFKEKKIISNDFIKEN